MQAISRTLKIPAIASIYAYTLEQGGAVKEELDSSAANTPATEPIPNGGWKAWLQVFGAHLLFFNSWGIINTFGAYQAYYESDLLRSHSGSQISWIGTVQGFLLILFSIVSGPLFDLGYHRALLVSGTFLVVFGMMMTSLATQYWQLFLAQGLVVGLGAGCLFLPSVAIVATYFTTQRALATGVVAAGGSIGSVIYPIVFRRLLSQVGFAWATRVIGVLAPFTLTISILIMRTRVPRAKESRALLNLSAFKYAPFNALCLGLVLAFMGLYVPFFYVIIYAQSKLKLDGDMSFYLLSVLNAASLAGRIIPGLLADKFGSLEVLIVTSLLSSLLVYCWLVIHNLAGIVVFCIFYGFLSGAVVSLPTTVVAALVPELRLMGTWMGMCFCFAGLGFLIGTPIAGTIINLEEGKFSGGLIFSATMVFAGTVAFTSIVVLKKRSRPGMTDTRRLGC
ncbi:MFS monocarboxylate transporter [Cordyceps militaris]|uniref:MFS monocarboxylate transporter n=1 Tax=Cordyceps militaris TaxID=73501 RepID=A0A2H4SUD9_CORMI|nr:MFS monocarboxylate transporter [Cordyceps militaris]